MATSDPTLKSPVGLPALMPKKKKSNKVSRKQWLGFAMSCDLSILICVGRCTVSVCCSVLMLE